MELSRDGPGGPAGDNFVMGAHRDPVDPADDPGAHSDRQVPDRGQDPDAGLGGGVQRLGLAVPVHRGCRAGFYSAAAPLPAGGGWGPWPGERGALPLTL